MKKLLTILITLILSICLINVNTNKTSAENEELEIVGRSSIIYMRSSNSTTVKFKIEGVQDLNITATKQAGSTISSITLSTTPGSGSEPAKLIINPAAAGYAVIRVQQSGGQVYKDLILYVEDGGHAYGYDDYWTKGSNEPYLVISNNEYSEFLDPDTKALKTDSSVTIINKVTLQEYPLTYNSTQTLSDYLVDEGCTKITVIPSVMETLPVGSYSIRIRVKPGATFHDTVADFDVVNPSTPEPQPKDESCEKVIGPSWHWNNDKGICEDYGVVGTYTR